MKLSGPPNDSVPSQKWKLFDNCPVCKVLKKIAETGREISEKELEEAFSQAEEEAVD